MLDVEEMTMAVRYEQLGTNEDGTPRFYIHSDDPAAQDLTALTDDELQDLDYQLADERLRLLEAHKPVKVERERRQVAAEAAARVAALSPAERDALSQALTVAGIDATEEV